MLRRILILGLLVAPLATHAPAAGKDRFPITKEQILEVLKSNGLAAVQGQIVHAPNITASESAPQLRVAGARRIGPHEIGVELACRSTDVCLPFIAFVHDPQGTLASATERIQSSQTPVLAQAAKPVVRPGEAARLYKEGNNYRISMAVICLQAGSTGDTIRARTTDGKLIYRAEVIAPGLLRALP